jgi:hypothetical protein
VSTSGALVFVVNGKEKTTYIHGDAYPGGVGADILDWIRSSEFNVDAVRFQVATLKMLKHDDKPSAEDYARYDCYADFTVNGGQGWYALLRETQGNPALILQAGVALNAKGFPLDSLHCEWAYVVDLDKQRFEVYKGFQQTPPTAGRWAGVDPVRDYAPGIPQYYPVDLLVSWSFDDIRQSYLLSHAAMSVVDQCANAIDEFLWTLPTAQQATAAIVAAQAREDDEEDD